MTGGAVMEPVDESAVQSVVMPYRPRETSETGLWAVTIRDAHNGRECDDCSGRGSSRHTREARHGAVARCRYRARHLASDCTIYNRCRLRDYGHKPFPIDSGAQFKP